MACLSLQFSTSMHSSPLHCVHPSTLLVAFSEYVGILSFTLDPFLQEAGWSKRSFASMHSTIFYVIEWKDSSQPLTRWKTSCVFKWCHMCNVGSSTRPFSITLLPKAFLAQRIGKGNTRKIRKIILTFACHAQTCKGKEKASLKQCWKRRHKSLIVTEQGKNMQKLNTAQ